MGGCRPGGVLFLELCSWLQGSPGRGEVRGGPKEAGRGELEGEGPTHFRLGWVWPDTDWPSQPVLSHAFSLLTPLVRAGREWAGGGGGWARAHSNPLFHRQPARIEPQPNFSLLCPALCALPGRERLVEGSLCLLAPLTNVARPVFPYCPGFMPCLPEVE